MESLNYDILLIEDNNDDVVLIKLALKSSGINGNILTINNGKTAIQVLKDLQEKGRKLQDIIIMDINLPLINGFEVLKYIKSNEETSSVPTIIFTSSDSMNDMKECYDLGADLFIRKPNNINAFKEIMLYIKNKYLKEKVFS